MARRDVKLQSPDGLERNKKPAVSRRQRGQKVAKRKGQMNKSTKLQPGLLQKRQKMKTETR